MKRLSRRSFVGTLAAIGTTAVLPHRTIAAEPQAASTIEKPRERPNILYGLSTGSWGRVTPPGQSLAAGADSRRDRRGGLQRRAAHRLSGHPRSQRHVRGSVRRGVGQARPALLHRFVRRPILRSPDARRHSPAGPRGAGRTSEVWRQCNGVLSSRRGGRNGRSHGPARFIRVSQSARQDGRRGIRRAHGPAQSHRYAHRKPGPGRSFPGRDRPALRILCLGFGPPARRRLRRPGHVRQEYRPPGVHGFQGRHAEPDGRRLSFSQRRAVCRRLRSRASSSTQCSNWAAARSTFPRSCTCWRRTSIVAGSITTSTRFESRSRRAGKCRWTTSPPNSTRSINSCYHTPPAAPRCTTFASHAPTASHR